MITPVLNIGQRAVGAGHPCLIIAEAGVNHDGRVEVAHKLIDAAVAAGADAVKFQTFSAAALATPQASLAQYQLDAVGQGSQLSMLSKLELPINAWIGLRDHAVQAGLLFLSTPFDEGSLELLIDLDVPAIKIASTDLTNHRLIKHAAASHRPVICSTGASTIDEVSDTVDLVRDAGGELALLHCVSGYPAPDGELDLRAMATLARRFEVVVGYSDHSNGTVAALAAVALGASIVEKHITLDRQSRGPDHEASAEPAEYADMVSSIRRIERMLGDGRKTPQSSERDARVIGRRSLVWARTLPAGALVAPLDLAAKRPGTGLSPTMEDRIVGRKVKGPVQADDPVSLDDLDDA